MCSSLDNSASNSSLFLSAEFVALRDARLRCDVFLQPTMPNIANVQCQSLMTSTTLELGKKAPNLAAWGRKEQYLSRCDVRTESRTWDAMHIHCDMAHAAEVHCDAGHDAKNTANAMLRFDELRPLPLRLEIWTCKHNA